jgi:hypothetical protein
MKVKRNLNQLAELQAQAHNYLIKNDFLEFSEKTQSLAWTQKPATKLSSALRNIIKQAQKIEHEAQEERTEIRIKNALTDEKTKALLFEKDGKTYQYSAEGLLKLRKEIKEYNLTEFDIHIRIQDEEVDIEEYDSFVGIVVPELKVVESE